MQNQIAWGSNPSRKNNLTKLWQRPAWGTVFFAVSLSVSAAPIVGGFNMAGEVTVSATIVDWNSNGPTNGQFSTNNPTSDYFSNIDGTVVTPFLGTAKDLTMPPGPVSRFLDTFTAPGYSGLFFDLTSVIAPTAPACTGSEGVNQPCSFGQFTLVNTGQGVAVNFGVIGFFEDTNVAASRSQGIGLYTTQLVGQTIGGPTGVLATISAPGGTIAATYSANYAANIPEPATYFLLAAGLGVVGLIRRRSN